MTNMTDDEYDDLAARVSALESQVRSLRARNVDFRGEFARVHEELDELRAELRNGLADVRREVGDLRGVVEAQSLRLDQHHEFHLSFAAGLASLSEDVRENSAGIAEILRRLDAA